MKNQIKLSIFFIFFCMIKCICQNISSKTFINFDDNFFPATEIFIFQCSKEGIGNLNVQIAKSGENGILKLEAFNNGNTNYIGGNVLVYLQDNSKITCIDKGIHDENDGKSIALYYFNNIEMEKLKNIDILKIQFTLNAKPDVYGSVSDNYRSKNYTAINESEDGLTTLVTSYYIKSLFD